MEAVSYTHLDVYKRQLGYAAHLAPPSYASGSTVLEIWETADGRTIEVKVMVTQISAEYEQREQRPEDIDRA